MSVRDKIAFQHELTKRHFHQIVCRPAELRPRMFPVWGVTWVPGDRSGTFLGKLFRPLGTPVMMVQVSHELPGAREGIALFGISSTLIPRSATVHYNFLRLKHSLDRRPRIDAVGPILDPREEGRGSSGKGAWLRLALQVERCRARAVRFTRQLPLVPRLPEVYFGFGRKDGARFEETPALRRRAAAGLPDSWIGRSLQDLAGRGAEASEGQVLAFTGLAADEQAARLRAAWEAAFIAPSDPGNSTGLWLLPHELTTDVYGTTRVFEYFGSLVGAPCYNTARELARRQAPNPTVELAREAGFDVLADLAALADTAEGSPVFQAIEERLVGLVPVLRARVQASEAISDEDLLRAICEPDRPVAVAPALDTLPEAERVRLLREKLAPHVSVCCTDADLITAAQQPNAPLWASGLCQAQILRRDVEVAPEEALQFSPKQLGRDRVSARLWFEKFRPEIPEPESVPTTFALAV